MAAEAGQKPSPRAYHQMEDGLDLSELRAKRDVDPEPVGPQIQDEDSPADRQSKPRIAIVMVALSVGVHTGCRLHREIYSYALLVVVRFSGCFRHCKFLVVAQSLIESNEQTDHRLNGPSKNGSRIQSLRQRILVDRILLSLG